MFEIYIFVFHSEVFSESHSDALQVETNSACVCVCGVLCVVCVWYMCMCMSGMYVCVCVCVVYMCVWCEYVCV